MFTTNTLHFTASHPVIVKANWRIKIIRRVLIALVITLLFMLGMTSYAVTKTVLQVTNNNSQELQEIVINEGK